MNCPNCNNIINETDLFCGSCGSIINDTIKPAHDNKINSEHNNNTTKQKNKENNGKINILKSLFVIALVLSIISISLIIYFLSREENNFNKQIVLKKVKSSNQSLSDNNNPNNPNRRVDGNLITETSQQNHIENEIVKKSYLITDGLIAHYQFPEMSDEKLVDHTNNQNNGIIYGATWQNINGIKSLSFNGVSNYISIPHNAIFNFDKGDFTVEVKFSTSVIPHGSWTALVSKHNTANWHDKEIFLGISGNSGLPFISLSDGNGYFENATGTVNICDGKFHTIRGLRYMGQLSLYLDGKLQATVVSNINTDNTNPVNIGRSSYNNGYGYFNGYISHVSIWNCAILPNPNLNN